MANEAQPFNCGATALGGWYRGKSTEKQLKEYEQEIKVLIAQAEAGWIKIIISTVLKDQDEVRKLLRKYGFKKTPECKSKYRAENTQCIYYWDSNAIKPKKVKSK